jgi:wyosine [tRNA(Phe)-imidazoG37] synthetase (radical SAM superfamily)
LKKDKKMQYVYGPVPSRRLGRSLGVDPIPLKTCNWNCVYCQLGRTKPLVNKRKSYFEPEDIVGQVQASLAAHSPGDIDWITFVGSGEPLLHAGLGGMIHDIKALTYLPVAVITNGTLLYQKEIRQELAEADAVMPSLDAGTPELYRKINRPHPDITFERLLSGLIAFRREYEGWLWIETMLVRGVNDTEETLGDLVEVLSQIEPDEVHLNLPTRPPAETWVRPPDKGGLTRSATILGSIAQVVQPVEGTFDLSGDRNIIDAIVGIITRHPMRQEELEKTLAKWTPGQVDQALAELETSGRAQLVERNGIRYWSAEPSFYPEETRSEKTSPGLGDRKTSKKVSRCQ